MGSGSLMLWVNHANSRTLRSKHPKRSWQDVHQNLSLQINQAEDYLRYESAKWNNMEGNKIEDWRSQARFPRKVHILRPFISQEKSHNPQNLTRNRKCNSRTSKKASKICRCLCIRHVSRYSRKCTFTERMARNTTGPTYSTNAHEAATSNPAARSPNISA